jgi:circadian clock protein KaiB
MLGLPEPPHFLVPCFTATVDRWLDPRTQKVRTIAEAAPSILRYQTLLNVVFATEDLIWYPLAIQEGVCDPMVLSTYRNQFPQLWDDHDLVVQYKPPTTRHSSQQDFFSGTGDSQHPHSVAQGYVLRLFVSGHNAATERTLQNLYRLLEQFLTHPYTLKVIDVFKHPEQAEADQVSATPTLVRVWPRPMRRIIGNLENVDQLLRVFRSPDEWNGEEPYLDFNL